LIKFNTLALSLGEITTFEGVEDFDGVVNPLRFFHNATDLDEFEEYLEYFNELPTKDE